MDPVSAVSFAASIATFIDFSWKLVRGSYDIYRSESDETAGHVQIGTVINDLKDVTKTMQADVTTDSPHRDFLKKLASDCSAVSTELSGMLNDLKRKEGNKIWRSIEAKWNTMRKEKDVASIEKRLNSLQLELLLRLNLIISEEQSSVKSKLAEIEEMGLHFSSDGEQSLKDVQQCIRRLQKAVVDEISENLQKTGSEQANALVEIRSTLLKLHSKLDGFPKMTTIEESILKRLYFPSIYARVERIDDVEFGTFDWLLSTESEAGTEVDSGVDSSVDEEPEGRDQSHQVGTMASDVVNENEVDPTAGQGEDHSNANSSHNPNPQDESVPPPHHKNKDEKNEVEEELRQQTRQSFMAWLETGNQVYHVSGKAGSGKSTLMKFLCSHPRVKEELQKWAGDKKLVFASFFFWNPGDDEQKTLGGLYRSLLFETLRQYPGLIKEAFPGYWARGVTDTPNSECIPFRFSELKEALRMILRKHSFPDHRFCFFVDGLDEFQADLQTDHWELAQSLQNWATSTDIKTCVSSRPHVEFLQCFNPELRMHLHELTRNDVRRFVQGVLEKNLHPFNEKSGIGILWKRSGIKSTSCREASNQCLTSCSTPSTQATRNDPTKCFCWQFLETPSRIPTFPYSSPIRASSDEEIRSRHDTVRCQLDGLSKGLLEMRPRSDPHISIIEPHSIWKHDVYFQQDVDFFHRTVKDYLSEPERLAIIEQRLGNKFNILEAKQRLRLAQFKFARTMPFYFKAQGLGQTFLVKSFYNMFREENFDYPPKFLDECKKVLEHHKKTPFTYPGEREENSGVIAWSQGLDSSKGSGTLTNNDISYMHWLASSGCNSDYVLNRLLEDPKMTLSHDGASLLLAASFTSNVTLAHNMLKAGVSPHGEITVKYKDTSVDNVTDQFPGQFSQAWALPQVTTAWAVVLFNKAMRLTEGVDQIAQSSQISKTFLLVEEFLNFGADCDASVVLEDYSESGGALVSISLEDFILHFHPPNLDVLTKLILRQKGSWLWQGTKQLAAMAVSSWTGDVQRTEMEYGRVQIRSLGSKTESYKVKAIRVGSHRLERGFMAPWF